MGYSLYQTLNISRQDMLSRLMDLDTISNNLANINTFGFRASRMNFQELLSEKYMEGVKYSGSQLRMTQGNLKTTENPFDWAILGEGFFQVKLPNGKIGYTRDGVFHTDSNRQLVNSSGYVLQWKGTIPAGAKEFNITRDGVVTATLENNKNQTIGTVDLASFANPSALINAGNNVFIESEASGKPQVSVPGINGAGMIQSYTCETANVNITEEMTHLIQVQRAFQMTTRVMQQTDMMIGEAIHLRKA